MTLKDLKFNDWAIKCFLAFMVVCPIYFHSAIDLGYKSLRISQEQIFQIGVTVLYAIFLVPNIFLASILLYSCFLYAYFAFPPHAGGYVLNLFMACVIYNVSYKIATPKLMKAVRQILLWLCFSNIVFMLLQATNNDFIYKSCSSGQYSIDLVGIMGLKAISGMFLCFCIPFVPSILVKLALLAPIYFTESSAAVFAGIVCILYEVFKRYGKKVLMIALVPLVIGGAFYIARDTKTGMFEDRAELWKTTMRDAIKRPVVGYGLDSFRNVSKEKPWMYFKNVTTAKSEGLKYDLNTKSFIVRPEFAKNKDILDPWDNAHNEFVQLFFEFGAIGVIIVLAFIRDIYKRFKWSDLSERKYIEPMMLVLTLYLIVSVGQFPFHMARTAYLIPIFLGFYYKLTENYIA